MSCVSVAEERWAEGGKHSVFMYDDIANNELNPRPGIIINHPQGSGVYAGVPKVTQI